jgi:fibronectin type 3 domain-containing protein/lysophospholipase L1-like esterase
MSGGVTPRRRPARRRSALATAVTVLVASLSLTVLTPGIASADVPTRIMPLGASYTHGWNVPGGYRIELERLLRGGRHIFNFAGAMRNGPDSLESKQHQGHPGYRIDEISSSIDSILTANPAEFVLLLVGTNDILQDYQLATAPQRLGTLMDQITAKLPSTHLLVGTLPPLTDPGLNAKVQAFNAELPGIVAGKVAQGKKVHLVDMYSRLTLTHVSDDGVHLTTAGYDIVGAAWFETLEPLLPPRPPGTPRPCPCTLWPETAVPATVQATWDTNPNELGVKFRSDEAGFIQGIRFYKGSQNTGTHVGSLWSRTGTLLGRATFTNETTSGWQEVSFAEPVPIERDTTYVASYFAPVGRYSVTNSYFVNNEVVSWPLRGLAEGMSGVNGVYRFGANAFPANSFSSTNYWVDVMFMPADTPPDPDPPSPPPAPTGLTATTASSSAINVSWTDVAGETGYRLERSPNGTSGWATAGTTAQDVTSFQDTGLSASTTYHYRVVATNEAGDSSPSGTASATTLGVPPPTPTGVTATAASQTAIDVSWTDVAGETGYRVERSSNGTSGWSGVGTTGQNVTTFRNTGLSASTTYFYRVVATNSAGDSTPSSVVSATTESPPPDPPSPPPAPSGVSATAASSSQINVSWTDVAGETGYRVERSPNGTTGWATAGTTAQDVTSFQDTGLSPSTTYHYRVVATNEAGDSSPSGTASATTFGVPPAAPTGVTATPLSTTEIEVAWTDVAGETGYRVERSPNGNSGWSQVGTTGQNVTTFQDTGLSASTTYFYRVVATNSAGDSAPSSVVSATTMASPDTQPPTAPGRLKATGAKGKVNLSWSASSDSGGSGLAGYEVWRATTADGPFLQVTSVSSSTTSYSDGSVLSSVTYWYYVVAVDGAGNVSPRSDIVSARPK